MLAALLLEDRRGVPHRNAAGLTVEMLNAGTAPSLYATKARQLAASGQVEDRRSRHATHLPARAGAWLPGDALIEIRMRDRAASAEVVLALLIKDPAPVGTHATVGFWAAPPADLGRKKASPPYCLPAT